MPFTVNIKVECVPGLIISLDDGSGQTNLLVGVCGPNGQDISLEPGDYVVELVVQGRPPGEKVKVTITGPDGSQRSCEFTVIANGSLLNRCDFRLENDGRVR